MKIIYYKRPELFFFLWLMAISSFSSCVREGVINENCENEICFVYDYNLEYVDLFSKQVSKLHLFVFDKNDRLITILEDETTGTFPDSYRMSLPLKNDTYTFVAWSGLYEESYLYETVTKSDSFSLDDLLVAVNTENESNIINKQLHSLWHGQLQTELKEGQTITIPLIKNTKTIRVVMKNLDQDGVDVDVEDFDFIIGATNGIYSYSNEPLGSLHKYFPYYVTNDPNAGAIAEINTLRLMADQSTTIDIIHKKTGKSVFGQEIELNTFLDALRLQEYYILPFQEYLDRSSRFSVILLYKGFDIEEISFASFSLEVNNWYIREQDY